MSVNENRDFHDCVDSHLANPVGLSLPAHLT